MKFSKSQKTEVAIKSTILANCLEKRLPIIGLVENIRSQKTKFQTLRSLLDLCTEININGNKIDIHFVKLAKNQSHVEIEH